MPPASPTGRPLSGSRACWLRDDGAAGCVVDVAVVPNARRSGIDGLHDGALRVRLAAAPVDGRANDALVAWLAEALGCARRDVTIRRGASSRRKAVAIARPSGEVAAALRPHAGDTLDGGAGAQGGGCVDGADDGARGDRR